MPPYRYKLLGVDGRIGGGETQTNFARLQGIAKRATDDHPSIVYNEMICATLGQVLGLPVPAWLVGAVEGEVTFVSMDFSLTNGELPPADPQAIVSQSPSLAWGIIAFDAWVLNTDRHARNLAYLTETGQTFIFDHGHALLREQHGAPWLTHHQELHGLSNHCLLPLMSTTEHLALWLERIRQVPDYVIHNAVANAITQGLHNGLAGAVSTFLADRRARLPGLMRDAIDALAPQIPPELNLPG